MVYHDFIEKKYDVLTTNSPYEDAFHIAFGVDESFVKPACINIMSIMENNPGGKFHFHIITTSISDSDVARVKSLDVHNCEVAITIYLINKKVFQTFQEKENLPISMYYRILLPNLLKGYTDRVLYLDADILCLNSVSELKDIDFSGNTVCAVNHEEIDPLHINRLPIVDKTHLLNSGVLLINIPAWLDSNVLDQFIDTIGSDDFQYPDQDVLNIILEGHVNYLSNKYNRFYSLDNSLLPDTVFMHFVGSPKPWKSWSPDIGLYLDYYYRSPWKDVPLELPNNYKFKKQYAKKMLIQKHYASSALWFFQYIKDKFFSRYS